MTYQDSLLPDNDIIVIYPVTPISAYRSFIGILRMLAMMFMLAEEDEPEWDKSEDARWWRRLAE